MGIRVARGVGAVLRAIGVLVLVCAVLYVWILFVPRVVKVSKNQLSNADRKLIDSLFSQNNLSQTYTMPHGIQDQDVLVKGGKRVRAYQLYSSIRVDNDLIFHFDKNGMLVEMAGFPIPNLPISADRGMGNEQLVGEYVRDLYLEQVKPINLQTVRPGYSGFLAGIRARSHPAMYLVGWAPVQMESELMVYDRNHWSSRGVQEWMLVWKVTPNGSDSGPYIIFDAQNGEILSSFNGLMH